MKPAYYNEIDPHAARWLRALIADHLIPYGEVDERSIADVAAADLRGFGQCHWFAGIAGWALAARLAGWPDDRELWTGSLPCQPWSCAGLQRGADDERDLWHHQLRLIAECRPATFFGEQVTGAIPKGWLDRACLDLEGEGYACAPVVLPAACVGALHRRARVWLVADAEWNKQPRQEPRFGEAGRVGRVQQPVAWNRDWESTLAAFRALDDGIPRCVAGTDAARNSISPVLAAEVIRAYMEAA